MESFADLFNASMKDLREGFNPGEKVEGTVVSIGKRTVFLDVGATSEGVINIDELTDKEGNVTVSEGDKLQAYFVSAKNGFEFTVKMSSESAASHLEEIYAAGIPVEGKVIGERNGGYTVKIGGQEAFCPFSQMDIRRGEAAQYIGQTFSFKITELKSRNFVVSRRPILEAEAAEKVKELQYNLVEGEIVPGTVTKLMDFGAFVDLGGMDGLIPISELAWWRVENVSEIVKAGDRVSVKIIKLDWANDRISLSLRQAGGDPWDELTEKYSIGKRYNGTITRLAPFGAFVQLEPGIEGLVHISKLGAGRRINHPKEVVEEGETVEVAIEDINLEDRRISLSMEESFGVEVAETPSSEEAPEDTVAVVEGAVIATGRVESIREFGVFVKLSKDKTGLLHVSKADIGASPNRFRALSKKFEVGATVEVVVESIDGDRISLALKESMDKANSENAVRGDFADKSGGSFGSLGGMFDGLNL